jgi:hypothetical protein
MRLFCLHPHRAVMDEKKATVESGFVNAFVWKTSLGFQFNLFNRIRFLS